MKSRLHPIAIGLALQAGAAGAQHRTGTPAGDPPQAVGAVTVAETTGGPAVRRPARARRSETAKRPAAAKRSSGAAASAPADAPVPALALTPEQREAIYRTVVRDQQVPAAAVAAAPRARVIAGPLASGQIVTGRPPIVDRTVPAEPDVPPPAGAAPRRSGSADEATAASYPVGARLPDTVPLFAIPEHVTMQMPQMRSFSYAFLDRRVLLVEPMTHRVIAEIDR